MNSNQEIEINLTLRYLGKAEAQLKEILACSGAFSLKESEKEKIEKALQFVEQAIGCL